MTRPKALARAARPARRRLPAEERRAQILAAAKEIFLAEGVERASMRNIAAKVGVTPTLIYLHFEDKEALLFALAEEFFATLIGYFEEAMAGRTLPIDRLKALMRAYIRCGLDHPREYQLTFMTGLPRLQRGNHGADIRRFRAGLKGVSPPIDPEEISAGMRSLGLLEAAVRGVIDARLARPTDVQRTSEIVWASGHGLVSLLITHEHFGWSPQEDLIEGSIDLMLHGLLT